MKLSRIVLSIALLSSLPLQAGVATLVAEATRPTIRVMIKPDATKCRQAHRS